MNEQELRARKAEIEAQFGPWTCNVPLGHGLETNPQAARPHLRLRRAIQAIADTAGKPWDKLRIVDLGSLEGLYALEFASHGAQVVAIEGRESNNVHARFAAQALECRNVEFITDDVRNLSPEKYGQFDVVFCSGILYHLDGADACQLLASIRKVCKRLTIVDTHVGLKSEHSIRWEGRSYSGFAYGEFAADAAPEVKANAKWASLDNDRSFWFTKPSLLNLLRDVGFTSVFEILSPQSLSDYSDRLTFAAIIGERQISSMSPELAVTAEPDWPEHSTLTPFPAQTVTTTRRLWRRVAGHLRRASGSSG